MESEAGAVSAVAARMKSGVENVRIGAASSALGVDEHGMGRAAAASRMPTRRPDRSQRPPLPGPVASRRDQTALPTCIFSTSATTHPHVEVLLSSLGCWDGSGSGDIHRPVPCQTGDLRDLPASKKRWCTRAWRAASAGSTTRMLRSLEPCAMAPRLAHQPERQRRYPPPRTKVHAITH
jgi:hypothetical protein